MKGTRFCIFDFMHISSTVYLLAVIIRKMAPETSSRNQFVASCLFLLMLVFVPGEYSFSENITK